MPTTREKSQLMSASEIDRTLVRLAHEILENTQDLSKLAFIGVRPSLPEPRVYFRRKLGIDASDADELADIVEEFQAKKRREGSSEDTNET